MQLLRFLVVDDNGNWRRLMRSILQDLGSVTECADGAEAVRVYADERPDWVFMDIDMGAMNGFAAASSIKSKFPDARIIFLSQYADESFREEAARLGAMLIVKDEVHLFQQLVETGFFNKPKA
jgi:CheY-like chemotaxis protein